MKPAFEAKSEPEPGSFETRVIVIGIGGATRSGKGTLARQIRNYIGDDQCRTVCQDQFFDLNIINRELGGNWEDPRAIDHERMLFVVKKLIERVQNEGQFETVYLVLEGFLLYHDKELLPLMDHTFWLEINKDTCYQRRMTTKRVPEQYFHKQLWPGYVKYRKRTFKNKEFVNKLIQYNGTDDKNQILQKVLDLIGIDTTKLQQQIEEFNESAQTSLKIDTETDERDNFKNVSADDSSKCQCRIL